MQKYVYTIICISLLLFTDDSFCQDSISTYDTLKIDQELSEKNDFLIEKYFRENLVNYDSVQSNQIIPKILLDSINCLFKLKLVTRMALKEVPGLDISGEIVNHNKQRALILLTSKEYYKNQPNYNLGEVGKYLGISKNIAAVILAIISL